MQMIGELNASHTGISGGEGPPDVTGVQSRYPGFDIEADESGYLSRFRTVYHKRPLRIMSTWLKPGNYILSVNGRELKTSDNVWQLLNLVTGRKFEFLINDKPEMDGAWRRPRPA